VTDSENHQSVHLLGPHEIRGLAAELDINPTKKLGQNFVIDPNTVRRIVAAADLSPTDQVIEVGPGLGSLTLALLEKVGDPVALLQWKLTVGLPHGYPVPPLSMPRNTPMPSLLLIMTP